MVSMWNGFSKHQCHINELCIEMLQSNRPVMSSLSTLILTRPLSYLCPVRFYYLWCLRFIWQQIFGL